MQNPRTNLHREALRADAFSPIQTMKGITSSLSYSVSEKSIDISDQ